MLSSPVPPSNVPPSGVVFFSWRRGPQKIGPFSHGVRPLLLYLPLFLNRKGDSREDAWYPWPPHPDIHTYVYQSEKSTREYCVIRICQWNGKFDCPLDFHCNFWDWKSKFTPTSNIFKYSVGLHRCFPPFSHLFLPTLQPQGSSSISPRCVGSPRMDRVFKLTLKPFFLLQWNVFCF